MPEGAPARFIALAKSRARVPEAIARAAAPYRVVSPFDDARRLANLARYAEAPLQGAPLLLVGLNPGIHGQMQTGIPFTDNERLKWYRWVEGLEGSAHRRIEQSSRLLYGCFEEASAGDGRAFHRGLFMVNAFPYCLLDPAKEAHPKESIEGLIEASPVLRAETERWLASACEIARPRAVVALGAFAAGMARPLAEKAGVPFEQAPHPRALLYEAAGGPKPRRVALIQALNRALPRGSKPQDPEPSSKR